MQSKRVCTTFQIHMENEFSWSINFEK
jgi:hypothetical protein